MMQDMQEAAYAIRSFTEKDKIHRIV